MKGTLGILGGMGALASAEFVRTVYEYNNDAVEQQAPMVILTSDPAFPDRTEAWVSGQTDVLVGRLSDRLEQLYRMGASRVVLCCVTLHFALPELPPTLRDGVVSLIDTIVERAAQTTERQLVLCSNGVRAARLFESHKQWGRLQSRLVFPDDADQQRIHRSLYHYKVDPAAQPLVPHLDRMLETYGADSFIAACTELHLMTRHLLARCPGRYRFIDPLLAIAEGLPALLASDAALAREAMSGRSPEAVRQERPAGF